MDKDFLKEIESLKKRVAELEALKKSNLNMFGRSYNLVGNSDSDFLIKTKGLVKIQWGSKFIDLIKDGKINVDSSFLFTVKSEDKIGIKDGIYLTDNGMVYLKIGGQLINLVGEIGNTYVSFLGELDTLADSKYTALRNIGFLYPDMSSFGEDSLQNGIIYIESEQKLYIVQNGLLSEFSIAFPNPFTEQFIILKNDTNNGALLIKGSGITNSLAFDSFYIFTEEGSAYLRSEGEINIMIDEETFVNVTQSKTTIKNIVEANTLQSAGASLDSGFMLYLDDNGSTLIVDNLIVRNLSDEISTGIYPVLWSLKHNVITAIDLVSDPTLGSGFALSLKYKNEYKVGDYIYFYGDMKVNDFGFQVIKIPALVKMLNTETGNLIYVEVLTNLIENVESLQELPNCIGKITYLIGSEEKSQLLRYAEHLIDLIECQTIEEEQSPDSILSRYGLLDDLNLKERDNVALTEPEIIGLGIYSKLGYFSKVGYESNYILSDDDDSTNLASTEWVNKKIKSLTIDIDLSIREAEDEINIEDYFSRPEILKLVQEQEVGTTVTYVGQFGIITVTKAERDYIFSAIVRALTNSLTWSHRSINGTYDTLTRVWYATSTYIIEDLFNPGYYWAKELKDSKPISPEYIGTTNTEIVSETIPYILYTNDGKVWKLIDKYIAPDPDLVYFSASGSAACNLQNAQTVPMGFIGIIKTDGTNLVNVGKSNYAISTFDKDDPTTGDIRGQIPKATRALLINTLKDALPGVIPSIPGLPTSFYIKKSDISTIPENSIHKLKSSEGGLSPATIFLDAKIHVRNITQSICRWTNSEGLKYNTTHPGTYKSVGDIDFWRNDLNIRILAGAVLCEIFQSVPNTNAKEVRDTVYSDVVGFALAYTATHWENFDFFLMSGVCESSFAAPTDDESNAKAGLRMNNSISIICNATHIYGEFHVTYRDYRWPESPDPNYPYLSAVWAIDDKTKINEAYRLPYPVEILLGLVFNGINARYKIEGTVGNGLSISSA